MCIRDRIYIVLPALLWLGIIWRAPRPAAMDALGRMSFPLYCIHYPIILLVLGSPQGLLIAVAALKRPSVNWAAGAFRVAAGGRA